MELVTDAASIVSSVMDFPFEATVASGDAAELLEDSFHEIAQAVVDSFDAGELPVGSEEDFDARWKAWIKATGKPLKRKGKRLFHPVRLAVTGAMSGPDIGAQLKLVSLADGQVKSFVPLEQRIDVLRTWLTENQPAPSAEEEVVAEN